MIRHTVWLFVYLLFKCILILVKLDFSTCCSGIFPSAATCQRKASSRYKEPLTMIIKFLLGDQLGGFIDVNNQEGGRNTIIVVRVFIFSVVITIIIMSSPAWWGHSSQRHATCVPKKDGEQHQHCHDGQCSH